MIEEIYRKSFFYIIIAALVLGYWLFLSKKYKNINFVFLIFMFFYRIPLIFVYRQYIPGDWIGYEALLTYNRGLIHFDLGTEGVTWLASYLEVFALNGFDYFFVFSLFGYFATTIFYIIIHRLTNYTDKVVYLRVNIFPWILLYPSLHVYTVMLGKDPMVYWGVAMITLGLVGKNVNWLYIIIGFLTSLLVRPHMAVILIVCLGVSLLFNNEWSILKKSILFALLSVAAVMIIPKLISLFRISVFSFEGIMQAIEKNDGYVNDAGTYIDMSNYPMILRMFTYLFRPLFIDSPNALLLEYSAENFLFFVMFIFNLSFGFFSWLKKQPIVVKFSFIYFMLGTLVLCNGLSLFGLFIRQKTMVFLNFLLLLFAYISYKNTQKIQS